MATRLSGRGEHDARRPGQCLSSAYEEVRGVGNEFDRDDLDRDDLDRDNPDRHCRPLPEIPDRKLGRLPIIYVSY
jgi:hypothetical protein